MYHEGLRGISMELKNSITKENLMRAFAGESQARNRYTFAASQAKAAGLHTVAAVFAFTANQEKEHAEIFYNYLKEQAGETIHIDGGYPVDIDPDVSKLLRYAQHNEYEEHDPVYVAFGDKAKEEGFFAIATTFYNIAKIEKTHGDRFGQLADLMEQGNLFQSPTEMPWLCLNCGHIHVGDKAPGMCPVCKHDQGYFYNMRLTGGSPCAMWTNV